MDMSGEKIMTSHGIPMSEESLKEWEQSFIDIEESIELVMESGEDL